MTVHHLVNGCPRQHRKPPQRIGAEQAHRLLTVTPLAACTGRISACGASRRVQALVAIGHSPARITRLTGISPPRLRRLLTGQTRTISHALHVTISAFYDQAWNKMPPERTAREQATAAAARRRAEAAGWPPPMALDDDRIDDPAYRPRIAWRLAAGTPPSSATPRTSPCG
jgi:hypothetical protein